MHIHGGSPHCGVSAKRLGNWHALDNAFFQPSVLTTYTTFLHNEGNAEVPCSH